MKDVLFSNEAPIAAQFTLRGTVVHVQHVPTGNINKTFLVTVDGGEESRFILQRINTHVFTQPVQLMHNMRLFSEHVRACLAKCDIGEGRPWEVPRVLLTRDNQEYFLDDEGEFWRAISFIDNADSFDTAQSEAHAYQVGWALGTFHALISDMDSDALEDTLPGFHIAPGYLALYDSVCAKPGVLEERGESKFPGVDACLAYVEANRARAHVLEDAKAAGKLPLRPIHGDPKINNVMIDRASGKAASLIDLDTVKPGLIHYDIGDCLRSGCNLLGEETKDFDAVRFEPELGRAILQGYLSQARDFLIDADWDFLFDGIHLIAFELGLRFFTDHLNSNIYFTADYDRHNLDRALVQLALARSIEAQEAQIRQIIAEMR